MTIAYIAFHFLTLWVNWSRQEAVMESARREHAEDQYRQAILEHEPLELLPMVEMELSSLRRTG